MYLKRITLTGFKSFPDTVHFDFSRGVTCIVGPNGCGKSNVVDAFKWVLGEQSAKLLRGRQMTDMIFNGSATRRSSSVAQVDLFFDNADRTLMLDFDDVVVSRKLYRSGESEYLINKQAARLKDVRDLFRDTGLGADAYSVIEQGRVDHLLEASPIDRRCIFEEAAGIGKYKARKREAERKLERVQQNLLRVDDIIEEVQKRLRSVKLQAGKARSFQIHDTRLKELRASFWVADFQRLTDELERLRRETDAVSDQATSIRTAIVRGEAKSAELAELTHRLADELSETERELMRARSEIAAHEERVGASERRIEEQDAAVSRVDARLEQLDAQREEVEARVDELRSGEMGLQRESEEQEATIAELVQRDEALARELNEMRAMVEDEKAGLVDLVRRSAHLRNEIASLEKHREALAAEQGRLGQREAAIGSELTEQLVTRNSLQAKLGEIDELVTAETARLEEKKTEAQEVQARRAELTQSLGRAKEQRSGLRSRLQLLEELQAKMEGIGAGVRQILEQKIARPDDAALAGIRCMIGDVFEADAVHARIIEAAIGELDQCVVVSESESFLADAKRFAALEGRLTAICLDRLPPVINEPDLSSQPGFVANAIDLVHYDESFGRLAKHLLGKTVVVDSLATALSMARADVSGRRFVTPDGALVEPDGRVSVGPSTSQAGLISRKSEHRDIRAQIAEIDSSVASWDEQLNEATFRATHLEETQQELRAAIYEANTARVEANGSLEHVNTTVGRLTQEQPLIAGEVASIEHQLAEAASRASDRDESVGQIDRENEERERVIASYDERIEATGLERDRVQYALTEARVAVGRLAAKRASKSEAIEQLQRGLQTTTDAVAAAMQEREDGKARIAESEDAILVARERLGDLSASSDRLEAGAMQIRRRQELTRLECEQLSASVKASRSELEEIESRMHESQLRMQESRVRRDELTTRVKEELGLSLSELGESKDYGDQDWEAVETEINELRLKIERLGNVNLDAINEQAELEERDQFLTSQRDDLTESRKQLEGLIRTLDAESIERFIKTFEAIRLNFRDLFRKLFGGGKADLILEDPDDPLECGIEIMAKPPGKELQRISLMSGGEKTLTAIALVMGIFRSRPAAFAILDEVDAALDEANNVRFNAIVREFLDRSQFIIVTHSKRTMSIADQLYGITMQEPGISARVSVRFEESSRDDQSAVA